MGGYTRREKIGGRGAQNLSSKRKSRRRISRRIYWRRRNGLHDTTGLCSVDTTSVNTCVNNTNCSKESAINTTFNVPPQTKCINPNIEMMAIPGCSDWKDNVGMDDVQNRIDVQVIEIQSLPSHEVKEDSFFIMFTPEQDCFILMAHFRSGTLNPNGTWSYSAISCFDQFVECFPKAKVHYNTFQRRKQLLVRRFESKNCVCKGKSTGRPSVVTACAVESIQNSMDQSPNTAVPKLSAQIGSSVAICHKALK